MRLVGIVSWLKCEIGWDSMRLVGTVLWSKYEIGWDSVMVKV